MTQPKENQIPENAPSHESLESKLNTHEPLQDEEYEKVSHEDAVGDNVDSHSTEREAVEYSDVQVQKDKNTGKAAERHGNFQVPPRSTPSYSVRVHVYDLFDEDCVADMGIAKLNLGKTLSSLNDTTLENMEMGFFHAGVEVCDVEYSFGYCEYGTGVYSCIPRGSPGYTYRCTIDMPHTVMDKLQIEKAIRRLAREWQGHKYSVIERNCCDFTTEVCVVLGVGPCPAWVNALATSFAPLARGAAAVSKIPTQISSTTRSIAWKPTPLNLKKNHEAGVESEDNDSHLERGCFEADNTYTTAENDSHTTTSAPRPSHTRQLSSNTLPGPISKWKEMTNSWKVDEFSSCFFCYQDDFEESGIDDSVHSDKSCRV